MNENQAALLFIGVLLGLFLLCAGLIVGIGKYLELKRKRAFNKYKDLRETSLERDRLNHKWCEESCECTRIYDLIKDELERKPYLTKVKAFQQEKELEKLRYELEKSFEKKQKVHEEYKIVNKKYLELAEKYKVYY